jgi:hypothetical protein
MIKEWRASSIIGLVVTFGIYIMIRGAGNVESNREAHVNWYQVSAQEAMERFGSSLQGLSAAEATQRLAEYG